MYAWLTLRHGSVSAVPVLGPSAASSTSVSRFFLAYFHSNVSVKNLVVTTLD